MAQSMMYDAMTIEELEEQRRKIELDIEELKKTSEAAELALACNQSKICV